MNYFVPNFGMDVDIADTFDSQKTAETSMKGEVKTEKKDKKESLVKVDLGMDREIISVEKSIKEAETEAGSLVEMGHLPEYM